MSAVVFTPDQRTDGRWAIRIECNGKLRGFLMWIDSALRTCCTVSDKDFAVQSFYCREEVEGLCDWLDTAYKEGNIK